MIYTKDLKTKFVEDLSKEAVSMDEFKEQLTKACIEEEIFKEGDTVDNKWCIHYIGNLADCDRTIKDKTIIYDLENCDPSEDKPLDSFFEINGFPFLSLCLGGDWECSLYGVLYTKKSTPGKFYLYLPLRGNTFNPDFMTAFGSEEERYSTSIDVEEWYKKHNDLQGDFEPELDKSLLMKDIIDAFNL